MQVIKKEIIESISNLPEEVEIEDIMYRLYVIDKIKKGQLAVKNKLKHGKVVTSCQGGFKAGK